MSTQPKKFNALSFFTTLACFLMATTGIYFWSLHGSLEPLGWILGLCGGAGFVLGFFHSLVLGN